MTINNRTSLIVNYWWTVGLPFICLCSMVTSGLSLLVLYKLRHLNRLYRLLYVKTLVNLVYLSICFWIFLVKCGHMCPPASNSLTRSLVTFSIQVYKHFIYGYVSSVLAYSDLLIEIMLSIERLLVMNNEESAPLSNVERKYEMPEKWYKSLSCQIIFVFVVSSLMYSPSLFFTRLTVDVQSPALIFPYRLQTVSAKLDDSIRTFTTVFMRSIPTLVLVVFINVLNFYYITRKVDEVSTFHTTNPNTISTRLVRSLTQANDRFKRILFYQSLLFTLGNSFLVVSYAVLFVWPDVGQFVSLKFLPLVNNTLLFSSLGLNYLLWVRYDQRFGQAFEELVAVPTEDTFFS